METGTGNASLPLRHACQMAGKSLLALLLLATSVAYGTPPAYTGTNSTCSVESFGAVGGGQAVSFIAISFALVSFCIALVYMYSKFHEDPAMGVWAKDEAFNLIISVLLFVGLLIFCNNKCSGGLTVNTMNNPRSQNFCTVGKDNRLTNIFHPRIFF